MINEFEDFLDNVVGVDKCSALGFDQCAVIAGYKPMFPLSNIRSDLPFILDKDTETFKAKLYQRYPGPEDHPIFMGRIRRQVFIHPTADEVFHIGQ